MIFDDIIMLALIKKYAQGSGGAVTPEEIEEAVTKYLEEHPVQPTPIDDTLSISGDAADAKATGDAIKESESRIEEKIEELQEQIDAFKQLIIDTTQETDVAINIVNAGTEAITSVEVEESYDEALNN